ncbi:MAG: DUF2442 domain-containing protein [Bacteroidia bacterium]|jgi:hypothetical protein
MTTTYQIQDISFDDNYMYLFIDGKKTPVLLAKISTKLSNASKIEKDVFKISPSGYGIHWPLIDEDLSVEALLKLA